MKWFTMRGKIAQHAERSKVASTLSPFFVRQVFFCCAVVVSCVQLDFFHTDRYRMVLVAAVYEFLKRTVKEGRGY